MSIIRVDKSAGRWEAIPVALTNDARLSLEGRGLAAWFMTRPTNWQIQAGALSGLLAIGRDRVKRLLRELEDAGYLVRTRSHDAEGRWIWESTFTPIPTIDVLPVDGETVNGKTGDGPPVDGEALAGFTVDGKGVDISKTRKTTRLKTTTEEDSDGCSPVSALHYPEVFSGAMREAASRALEGCPEDLRQAVLDEVAGLAKSSRIRGSAVGLLRALVASARRGDFVPTAGIEIARVRPSSRSENSPPIAEKARVGMSDLERAEVKRKLAALRTKLVTSAAQRP